MLSVFTLKYAFCMGWHSGWCLVLNYMIQRRSWEVTHRIALELPTLNTTAEVPTSVQCDPPINTIMPFAVLMLALYQFLLPSIKRQRAAGAQDVSPYMAISHVRPHLPRAERTQVQLPASYMEGAIKHYPFTSLPLKTFFCSPKSSWLPWKDCLCWRSLGSTTPQSSTPESSVRAALSRGVSRLWRYVVFKSKFEAKILLNPIFWMVPTMKSHQWRNRNNRHVIHTNWDCC